MADTRKQIPLRLPPDLADAIDHDRPSTLSRNAWIEDACRRKLGHIARPATATPDVRSAALERQRKLNEQKAKTTPTRR